MTLRRSSFAPAFLLVPARRRSPSEVGRNLSHSPPRQNQKGCSTEMLRIALHDIFHSRADWLAIPLAPVCTAMPYLPSRIESHESRPTCIGAAHLQLQFKWY